MRQKAVVRRGFLRLCTVRLVPGVLILTGCHTMRPVQPAQLNVNGIQADPPARVWVTRADHSVLVLDSPRLNGDTLTGIAYGEPLSVPLSQMTALRTEAVAPLKIVALATLTGAVLFSGLWYMQHRPDVNPDTPFCGNAIGNRPMPLIPCCYNDTLPC